MKNDDLSSSYNNLQQQFLFSLFPSLFFFLSSFSVFYCTLQIAHKLQRRNRRNGKRACAYTIIISL